ncbi:MAG: alanine:cation symporter family protein [Gammaproteobacteria bacterium AqS3]|nr:alanine:cation symporter family protein [Gammaproteobacteria bacterium AqS3]
MSPVADALSGIVFYAPEIFGVRLPLIVLWLVLAGLFFTAYTGFLNVRGMRRGINLLLGRDSDPQAHGEVNALRALSTAVAGTVGIGNIGGVAIAVSLGGPGVVFWLIVAGFLGMSTKMIEAVMGVAYRQEHEDGSVSGGPMHYLSSGLADLGLPKLGRVLALFYAGVIVFACLGIGNMFQSNQAFEQFTVLTGGAASEFGWLFGLVLAGLTGAVIVGGLRSIAEVTVRLVPFMAVLYCIGAVAVVLINADKLPGVFADIVAGAFTAQGAAGGALGALIIGFQRAAFSNEAGLGSAAIAHASVRTRHPATEGLVALLEPFIDTVIISTLTALVILTTVYDPNVSGIAGIELTSRGFATMADWTVYLVALAAVLFAFSTMVAWSYYGLKGWTYLVGRGRGRERAFQAVFLAFVVIGCTLNLEAVLNISDALIFLVAVPNIIGLYLLAPRAKALLNEFLEKK